MSSRRCYGNSRGSWRVMERLIYRNPTTITHLGNILMTTRRTIYSHTSICDFLEAHGYRVIECRPRFLPLTIKSSLPVSPFLIRLYLASPVKPMGKQMFVRARPRKQVPLL